MRGIPFKLLVGGAGTLLGLGLAEAGLRVVCIAVRSPLTEQLSTSDPLSVKIRPLGDNGYRQKPTSVYRYVTGAYATSNAMGFRGPEVRIPKSEGTFRIVLLGGSSTHGWGVPDDQTIDAYMREELRRRYPGIAAEVVNLAFDGFDSRQDLERLKLEGLALEPDVVIVNNGINDVRNARFSDLGDPDPRTLLFLPVVQRLRKADARGGPELWDRIKHVSYVARLPGVIATNRFNRAELKVRERVTPNPAAIDIYERNLTRIAGVAGAAGVAVLFSAAPSSLPFKYDAHGFSDRNYWVVDAKTTQAVREEMAARMRRVARAEAAAGRSVALVSPPRLTGDDFFDDCHLTPEGNRRLALRFVEVALPYMSRVMTHDRRAGVRTDVGVLTR